MDDVGQELQTWKMLSGAGKEIKAKRIDRKLKLKLNKANEQRKTDK